MRIRSFAIVFTAVVSIVIFMGCRLSVPVREMTGAKSGITAAQKVMAEKYAAEELESAKNKLLQSHDHLVNKDVDNAKKAAEESSSLSLVAYNKSLPLLVKDTIAVAEKSLNEAGEVYAERLAPEEYREAEDSLKMANEQFQNKQYSQAYDAAIKADEKAKQARNTALGKKDVLRDSIIEVKRTIEEAERYGAKKFAPDKLNLANENVDIAEKSYDAQELKKGFSAIEVAKLNADEALIAALKNTAAEKIAAAEQAVAEAAKSKLAAQRTTEMNAAKESLDNAKAKMADSKYKESIIAAEEAMRLAKLVTGKKAEGTEIAEGDDVRQQHEQDQQQQQQSVDEKDYFLYKVQYREHYKDCLWYIAKKFYKDGMKWKIIYNRNTDMIRNPNLILPGWELKVPYLKKRK